jgi:hypothetical protein
LSHLALPLTPCFVPASEWFLSKLLAYRREFLYVRVGILSVSIKGAVVSWVDVILANVAMVSVYIASDTADVDGMGGTLASQRENEAILAASQLPCKRLSRAGPMYTCY